MLHCLAGAVADAMRREVSGFLALPGITEHLWRIRKALLSRGCRTDMRLLCFLFKKKLPRGVWMDSTSQNHTLILISSVPGGRDTRRWLWSPSRRTWRARTVCELPDPRVHGVSVRLGLVVRDPSLPTGWLHANCALALALGRGKEFASLQEFQGHAIIHAQRRMSSIDRVLIAPMLQSNAI